MRKAELAMLERAYETEISSALYGLHGILKTRSKLAAKLVSEGYLREATYEFGGRFTVIVRGYALTELGRITYCMSCEAPA